MNILLHLTPSEVSNMQFPIVVELFDRTKFGRGRRAYHMEFTPDERRKVRDLYNLFYRWHLVTGTPSKGVSLTSKKLLFMQRVINFFASL